MGKRTWRIQEGQFWPGKASDYIRPIDELRPGQPVVLVCRESGWKQHRNGNLLDQLIRVRNEVESRGGVVVYEHSYIGSGWDPDIGSAVIEADKHGAVLVAETVDRLMRPTDYHSVHNPNAVLRDRDLRMLRHLTWGLPLMTIEHPDAAPGQNRSRQTRRGQEAKGNRGGRPVKGRKAFRRKWEPLARELREVGWGLRRIAKEISRRAGCSISHTAVGNWLRQTRAGP